MTSKRNQFNPNDRVVMSTYPHEEFIYVADDGKMAELISDAGTLHYRRLEFLEHRTTPAEGILMGTVRAEIFSKMRNL